MNSWQQPKSGALIVACLSGLLMIAIFLAGLYLGKVTTVKGPALKPVIKRLDKIEEKQKATDSLITSATAPLQQINAIPRIRYLSDRGGTGKSWVDRINRRLEGTPLAGHGRDFALAAADAGIPPNLSVAIALHESGAGRFTPPGSKNPFGMTAGTAPGYGVAMGKGDDGTRLYQAFPSWEAAIKAHAVFIARTWPGADGPEDLRGYAVSSSWLGGVRGQMAAI